MGIEPISEDWEVFVAQEWTNGLAETHRGTDQYCIANPPAPRLNDPSWEQFGNDKKNSRSKTAWKQRLNSWKH